MSFSCLICECCTAVKIKTAVEIVKIKYHDPNRCDIFFEVSQFKCFSELLPLK